MKILLAIDGSTCSEWATELVTALPAATSAAVTALYVVEPLPAVHAMFAPSDRNAYTRAMREHAEERRAAGRRLMERTVARLKRRLKRVRGVIEDGPAAEAILGRARREKFDLVVLGSRGLGHVKTFMVGSVSHKVAAYAPCSVLVVKHPPTRLTKVLLALDGSVDAENAAGVLRKLFRSKRLQTTAVFAWESPVQGPMLDSAVAAIRERCLAVTQRAGLRADFMFVTGRPAAEITRIARQKNVGLVVVGSRGLTGMKRFLLGSVSHAVVLHSPASVLVVRH